MVAKLSVLVSVAFPTREYGEEVLAENELVPPQTTTCLLFPVVPVVLLVK